MLKDVISIIIPVYNASAYLDKCIMSILGQTYSNFELIIVNDGSTDNSAEVISKYLTDSRVKYIEQQNAGAVGALNTGMKNADGEYITYVGNDDYIEPNMYETMLNALKSTNADVAVCDFNLVYEDGRENKNKYSKTKNEVMDLSEDLCRYFVKCCVNPQSNNYIWSRLYKTELIKNSGICFEKIPIGEDTLFNFKLLVHIDRVVFLENGFYNYFQRSSSVVHTIAKKQSLSKFYAEQFELLCDYYKNFGNEALLEMLPILAFTRLRSVFFYSRLSGMGDDEILEGIAEDFVGKQIGNYITGR
ncbi:MAG: glycosyltransferase [Defluviitaleaceae bacterium]|nr:glycosyltransferase [Defluviitaleaceae bacterium]